MNRLHDIYTHLHHSIRRTTFTGMAALLALSGCVGGDWTSANGDYGVVSYTLHSDYFMTSEDLRAVRIVTGHPQEISISLSEEAQEELTEEDVLTHRFAQSTGAEITSDGAPMVLSDMPGSYLLQTLKNGSVLDQIPLQFDEPGSLEVLTWVRTPGLSEFSQVDEDLATTVPEGTQATFLNVPLDRDGYRLAGNIETEYSVEPAWAAVRGENVDDVYEDFLNSGGGALSIYFIEPGTVTVTFADPINGVEGQHEFHVTPVETGNSAAPLL